MAWLGWFSSQGSLGASGLRTQHAGNKLLVKRAVLLFCVELQLRVNQVTGEGRERRVSSGAQSFIGVLLLQPCTGVDSQVVAA